MVFPQFNYEHRTVNDFNSWTEWVSAVNQAENYCKQITDIYEFDGKCKPTDLPAFHPYWHAQSEIKTNAYIKEMEIKFALCVADSNLIKIYFNKTATIQSISENIERMKQSLLN